MNIVFSFLFTVITSVDSDHCARIRFNYVNLLCGAVILELLCCHLLCQFVVRRRQFVVRRRICFCRPWTCVLGVRCVNVCFGVRCRFCCRRICWCRICFYRRRHRCRLLSALFVTCGTHPLTVITVHALGSIRSIRFTVTHMVGAIWHTLVQFQTWLVQFQTCDTFILRMCRRNAKGDQHFALHSFSQLTTMSNYLLMHFSAWINY